jgi:hypothetical protein
MQTETRPDPQFEIQGHLTAPGREPRAFRGPSIQLCRIHKTLRVTPAMAAAVADRLWEIGDVVNVRED